MCVPLIEIECFQKKYGFIASTDSKFSEEFNAANKHNPSNQTLNLAHCPQHININPEIQTTILVYGHKLKTSGAPCLIRFQNLSRAPIFRVCAPKIWLMKDDLEFNNKMNHQQKFQFEPLKFKMSENCVTRRKSEWSKTHPKHFICLWFRSCEYLEYHFNFKELLLPRTLGYNQLPFLSETSKISYTEKVRNATNFIDVVMLLKFSFQDNLEMYTFHNGNNFGKLSMMMITLKNVPPMSKFCNSKHHDASIEGILSLPPDYAAMMLSIDNIEYFFHPFIAHLEYINSTHNNTNAGRITFYSPATLLYGSIRIVVCFMNASIQNFQFSFSLLKSYEIPKVLDKKFNLYDCSSAGFETFKINILCNRMQECYRAEDEKECEQIYNSDKCPVGYFRYKNKCV